MAACSFIQAKDFVVTATVALAKSSFYLNDLVKIILLAYQSRASAFANVALLRLKTLGHVER